jgi:transcriptional regulator with XRE-family HTH domain
MLDMPRSPFSQFLFDAFIEWEKSQPGQRSNFTKFADYLGVKQQAFSSWINDRTIPNLESAELLASKLGKGIYNILSLNGPDPDLQALSRLWPHLSEEARRTLLAQGEKYAAENEQPSNQTRPVEKAA